MKDNKRIYIISSILIAVSVVILLVFVFLPKGNTTPLPTLNCSVSNIEMSVGEKKTDFYTLSNEDASVVFSIDREGIVEINDREITALSKGKVNVEMKVSLGKQSITENFTITVYDTSYSLTLTPILDCEAEGDTIYMSSKVCQFSLCFLAKDGSVIEDAKITYSLQSSANLQYSFGVYMLQTDSNVELTFKAEEYNFEKTFNVVLI